MGQEEYELVVVLIIYNQIDPLPYNLLNLFQIFKYT